MSQEIFDSSQASEDLLASNKFSEDLLSSNQTTPDIIGKSAVNYENYDSDRSIQEIVDSLNRSQASEDLFDSNRSTPDLTGRAPINYENDENSNQKIREMVNVLNENLSTMKLNNNESKQLFGNHSPTNGVPSDQDHDLMFINESQGPQRFDENHGQSQFIMDEFTNQDFCSRPLFVADANTDHNNIQNKDESKQWGPEDDLNDSQSDIFATPELRNQIIQTYLPDIFDTNDNNQEVNEAIDQFFSPPGPCLRSKKRQLINNIESSQVKKKILTKRPKKSNKCDGSLAQSYHQNLTTQTVNRSKLASKASLPRNELSTERRSSKFSSNVSSSVVSDKSVWEISSSNTEVSSTGSRTATLTTEGFPLAPEFKRLLETFENECSLASPTVEMQPGNSSAADVSNVCGRRLKDTQNQPPQRMESWSSCNDTPTSTITSSEYDICSNVDSLWMESTQVKEDTGAGLPIETPPQAPENHFINQVSSNTRSYHPKTKKSVQSSDTQVLGSALIFFDQDVSLEITNRNSTATIKPTHPRIIDSNSNIRSYDSASNHQVNGYVKWASGQPVPDSTNQRTNITTTKFNQSPVTQSLSPILESLPLPVHLVDTQSLQNLSSQDTDEIISSIPVQQDSPSQSLRNFSSQDTAVIVSSLPAHQDSPSQSQSCQILGANQSLKVLRKRTPGQKPKPKAVPFKSTLKKGRPKKTTQEDTNQLNEIHDNFKNLFSNGTFKTGISCLCIFHNDCLTYASLNENGETVTDDGTRFPTPFEWYSSISELDLVQATQYIMYQGKSLKYHFSLERQDPSIVPDCGLQVDIGSHQPSIVPDSGPQEEPSGSSLIPEVSLPYLVVKKSLLERYAETVRDMGIPDFKDCIVHPIHFSPKVLPEEFQHKLDDWWKWEK